MLINLKIIPGKFFRLADLSGTQGLNIHESAEINMIGKYKKTLNSQLSK